MIISLIVNVKKVSRHHGTDLIPNQAKFEKWKNKKIDAPFYNNLPYSKKKLFGFKLPKVCKKSCTYSVLCLLVKMLIPVIFGLMLQIRSVVKRKTILLKNKTLFLLIQIKRQIKRKQCVLVKCSFFSLLLTIINGLDNVSFDLNQQ